MIGKPFRRVVGKPFKLAGNHEGALKSWESRRRSAGAAKPSERADAPTPPAAPSFTTEAEAEAWIRALGVTNVSVNIDDAGPKEYETLKTICTELQRLKAANVQMPTSMIVQRYPATTKSGTVCAGFYSPYDSEAGMLGSTPFHDCVTYSTEGLRDLSGTGPTETPEFEGLRPLVGDRSIEGCVAHEIGHCAHFHTPGWSTEPARLTPAQARVAASVSRYATTNKLEFVAEVFSGVAGGKTFAPAVMNVYHALKGPKLPPSRRTALPVAASTRMIGWSLAGNHEGALKSWEGRRKADGTATIPRSPYAEAPRVFKTPDDLTEVDDWGTKRWGWKDRPGELLSGRPLTKADLPPTLFHVTTAADAVESSGVLLGQHADAGLGGGSENGVSFTVSMLDAHVIERDLRRVVDIARGDADIETLAQWARDDEFEGRLPAGALDAALKNAREFYDGNVTYHAYADKTARTHLVKEAFDNYLWGRQTAGEKHQLGDATTRTVGDITITKYDAGVLKNPLFFSDVDKLAKLDRASVRTLRVPTKNIPDRALITTGSDDFLHEVRVYSDVPVGGTVRLAGNHEGAVKSWEGRRKTDGAEAGGDWKLFFHGTAGKNLKSIFEHGLEPDRKDAIYPNMSQRGIIYMISSRQGAISWAENSAYVTARRKLEAEDPDNEPHAVTPPTALAVLEIHAPADIATRPDRNLEEATGAVEFDGRVPPEWIVGADVGVIEDWTDPSALSHVQWRRVTRDDVANLSTPETRVFFVPVWLSQPSLSADLAGNHEGALKSWENRRKHQPAAPVPPLPPAFQTADEATTYVKALPGVERALVKTADLPTAHTICATLGDLANQGVPMPENIGIMDDPPKGVNPETGQMEPLDVVSIYEPSDDKAIFVAPRLAPYPVAAPVQPAGVLHMHVNPSVTGVVAHELGHAAHFRALFHGRDHVVSTTERDGAEQFASAELTGDDLPLAAHDVSAYAMTNRAEFVAEVFAGVAGGQTFGGEVLDLYARCKGPALPTHPVRVS
jgi:hypothetical protein